MSEKELSKVEFFTSVLSHDINNFNQTIRGYLEMLLNEQMGTLTDEQARAVDICWRQSRRIQTLIESVRILREIENIPCDPKPIDLDEAIEHAIQSVQSDFFDREIRVQFSPAKRKALADEHLETIFRYLLNNAARFNESEAIEIFIQIGKQDAPSPVWHILIADNGRGVPELKRPQIFTRLENREIHGTGLGLCTVRELVNRYHGKIWLEENQKGKGAVFGLHLLCA